MLEKINIIHQQLDRAQQQQKEASKALRENYEAMMPEEKKATMDAITEANLMIQATTEV